MEYKHKKTGLVVFPFTVESGKNNYTSEKGGVIPKELIEGSEDWQEITEVIEVEITKGYGWYKGMEGKKFKVKLTPGSNYAYTLISNNNLWISTDNCKLVKEENIPDYTILSFKRDIKEECIFVLNNSGRYSLHKDDIGITLEDISKNSAKTFIHSIRREIDGQIFTIGDEVDTWEGKQKIKEIYMLDGYKLRFWLTNSVSAFASKKPDYSGFEINLITKVKPKEWEITAYKNICVNKIITQHMRGKSESVDFNISASRFAANATDTIIYSVKRLSDGVEFKIGEKVGFVGEIQSIDIAENNCIRVRRKSKSCGRSMRLEYAKKVISLFTTDDGKEIFPNDYYYSVSINEFVLNFWQAQKNSLKNPTYKDFSTKEAAEQYIMYNKPCLSINDIKNSNAVSDSMIPSFEELVKSKLK